MRKSSRNTMRLFLLIALLLSLSLTTVVAFAQETTPVGETDENAAAESEAAEVGGDANVEGQAVEGEGDPGEGGEVGAAEEGRNPLTPLGINTGFLLAQILNFLLIFALLYFLLWPRLANMLDSRAVKIQQGLEDAARAANERRNAEAEAEKILAAARADAARVVEEARGRGEEVARSVESTARAEADAIRTEARARATEERDRQLADVRTQVAAISVALAQRLIGESLDQSRQQALITDFFAKVPAEARSLAGQSVEVVSALPLSDAEKQQIQNQIGASNVTFNVDPGILGGLVLRTEQRVVDGSVRSNLNNLAARLR
jgi:F-type H+-transporting ATPase subunit b